MKYADPKTGKDEPPFKDWRDRVATLGPDFADYPRAWWGSRDRAQAEARNRPMGQTRSRSWSPSSSWERSGSRPGGPSGSQLSRIALASLGGVVLLPLVHVAVETARVGRRDR